MTKVSLYVDDAIWASFREQVFKKYGNLRKLSSEVEKLLQDAAVEDTVISEFKKIGLEAKGAISSKEIKATRPSLKGPPAEEMLQEMRQKRLAQPLPRH
jgi:hypothetical protein